MKFSNARLLGGELGRLFSSRCTTVAQVTTLSDETCQHKNALSTGIDSE
jgi:hypothetical protein